MLALTVSRLRHAAHATRRVRVSLQATAARGVGTRVGAEAVFRVRAEERLTLDAHGLDVVVVTENERCDSVTIGEPAESLAVVENEYDAARGALRVLAKARAVDAPGARPLLTLALPEKFHLRARMAEGDLRIEGRLEGDVDIVGGPRTNVDVKALTGLTLAVHTEDGRLTASKRLEGDRVSIMTKGGLDVGLIHARHADLASTGDVRVGSFYAVHASIDAGSLADVHLDVLSATNASILGRNVSVGSWSGSGSIRSTADEADIKVYYSSDTGMASVDAPGANATVQVDLDQGLEDMPVLVEAAKVDYGRGAEDRMPVTKDRRLHLINSGGDSTGLIMVRSIAGSVAVAWTSFLERIQKSMAQQNEE